jgi:hypothetical protein
VGDYDDDLPDLRYHWGSAYLISHPKLGLWIAQRRDTRETLRAESASELLEKIRADYARHPVSRRIAVADDRPETPGCRFLPEG